MGKGCFNCLRVLVFIINILFLLIGLAILGLSLFLYFDSTVKSVKDKSNMKMNVDIMLFAGMAIGGLTALVSAFGCCGAYHESGCLLGTYLVCLLAIAGLEIAGGAFLYIKRNDPSVKQSVTESIQSSIRNVNATTLPAHINKMQQTLECCGANNTEYDTETAKAVCTKDGKRFTEGCASKIFGLMETHGLWVLVGIISVAGLELLSMILALYLCCSRRRDDDGYVGVTMD